MLSSIFLYLTAKQEIATSPPLRVAPRNDTVI